MNTNYMPAICVLKVADVFCKHQDISNGCSLIFHT